MTARTSAVAAEPKVPAHAAAEAQRWLVVWLFVLMSALFLLFQEGAITGFDGGTVYEVTRSIVEQGDVAISDEWNTLPGRGGREFSKYGIGLSLVGLVPYALARPLAVASGRAEAVLEGAVSSMMPLIAAALVVALYLLTRRLGATVGAALLVAVGAIAGTYVLPYSKEFFSEPLAALGLVAAIERSLGKYPATSGLWLSVAILARPQSIVSAPLLVLVSGQRLGIMGALRTIAGCAPGIIATLAYNTIRFDHPLLFGYQDVGFTTPFLQGASGLLIEPRKSIFLFAPVTALLPFALARLWRRDPMAFVLLGGNLAIVFMLTAVWFAWHGGWCWGPRLLIPGVVPALAVIAPWLTTRTRRRAAAALLGMGLLLNLPALLVPTQAQQLEVAPPPPETYFLDTTPLHSPSMSRQLELVAAATRYSIEHRYERREDGRNYLRYLSLWHFGVARVFGRAGLIAAGLGTIFLLAVAVVALRRVRAAALAVTADVASTAAIGRRAEDLGGP